MPSTARNLFMAPGELLMAATGLAVALRPGPVRITQAVLGKANPIAMEKAIKRKLVRFMKGELPREDEPVPFDYDEVCDLLPQMQHEARNVENVAGFQSQVTADAYAEQLGVAVGYVQREIPDKVQPIVIAGQRLRAPDYDVASFARKYKVLERPLLVLDEMGHGWLLDDQVDTLAAVYPAIYNAIRSSVIECLVTVAAGRPSWRLPFAKDLQLGILLKEPRLDGQVHAAMLQRWEERRAEESKGHGVVKPPTGTQRRGVGDPSTQQERLEAK